MKPEWIRDGVGVLGLILLSAGAWFEFGPGYAAIICGALLLTAAVAGTLR